MCCEIINHQHKGTPRVKQFVGNCGCPSGCARVCLCVEHLCDEQCDCARVCICVECASPVVSIYCVHLVDCVCSESENA